jgi:predicted metal-dependent phosphoesterase TrpH
MLKFARNKVVNVVPVGDDTLQVHGLLDDDIYSLQVELSIRLPELILTGVHGRWNRWTTPECHLAVAGLPQAEGWRITPELPERIHKQIGRKACRHFANLLVECCDAARQAARLLQEEVPDQARCRAERVTEAAEAPDPMQAQAGPVSAATSTAAPRLGASSGPATGTVEPAALEPAPEGFHVDLHVHTSPASPCSNAPVDALIAEARSIGLDAICLTDHNYLWTAEAVDRLRQQHGFLVLRGNEVTTDQGDVLVFGFETAVAGIVKLADLAPRVRQAGGYLIAAHPFRGFLTFGSDELGLTTEKAAARPMFRLVDALEVLNGKVTPDENAFSAKVAAALNLPATGGSDAHEVAEIGQYATRFSVAIHNESELIESLHSGRYTPVAYRKENCHGS